MTRAAIAFMSGPAAKLMRAFKPYFLLKASSISAIAFLPPKVCAPAMKLNSPSFLAAVTISSMVAARTPESAGASSKKAGRQRDRIFFKFRLVEQIFVGHEPEGFGFRSEGARGR